MTKFQAPNVPFVEAHLKGGKQKPTAIEIELSWTTSDKGAALGVAQAHHGRNTRARSFHYMVDESETYRGVWDNVASCAHARNAISILICAEPRKEVRMWWDEATAEKVLYRAADLVAELCLAHRIQPRYLSEDETSRWLKWRTRRRGGLIVRIEGAWPRQAFMDDVRAGIKHKRHGRS